MDEKPGDRSADSMKKHKLYFMSLNNISKKLQEELDAEHDPELRKHLEDRIQAIKKDMQRIEHMFPDTDWVKLVD